MKSRFEKTTGSLCALTRRKLATIAVFLLAIGVWEIHADEQWETSAPIIEQGAAIETTSDQGDESSAEGAPVVKGRPAWANATKNPVTTQRGFNQIHGLYTRGNQRPSIVVRVAQAEIEEPKAVTNRSKNASMSSLPNLTRAHYQAAHNVGNSRGVPTQLTRATNPRVFQPSWMQEPAKLSSIPNVSKAQRAWDSSLTGESSSNHDCRDLHEDKKSDQESMSATVPPVEMDLSADGAAPDEFTVNPSMDQRKLVSDLDRQLWHRAMNKSVELAQSSPSAAKPPVAQPPAKREDSVSEPSPLRRLPTPPEPVAVPPPTIAEDSPSGTLHDEEEFKPIGKLQASIALSEGDRPTNMAEARFAREGYQPHVSGFSRFDVQTVMNWEAPALCHRPLYFEEVNLERHGYQVPLLQPVVSGAHFFTRIPAVPYLVASQHHQICNYTLGHYRPGSVAPYVWYYPNFSLDGAAVESLLITGLMYAVP